MDITGNGTLWHGNPLALASALLLIHCTNHAAQPYVLKRVRMGKACRYALVALFLALHRLIIAHI